MVPNRPERVRVAAVDLVERGDKRRCSPPRLLELLEAVADLVATRLEAPQHRFLDVLAVQDRIRAVLAEPDSLSIVYQPIVELPSEHVVGYEALARFPGSTPSPPDVWFADAHAVGLGIELELLAARRAVTSFAATSPGPFLSVNLCTAALSGEHLDDVLELCDPSCTVVELTEGRPEKGELAVIDRDRLRRRGIRLAVDDLGAGFAGLTRLIELEPEIVKLDRFLTMGISTDPRRSALAAATRHFCSAVDVDLIAEGVETGSDRDALLDLEVPFAQGYLFGRPAPPPMGSPG